MDLRLNSQCTPRSAGGNFEKLQMAAFLSICEYGADISNNEHKICTSCGLIVINLSPEPLASTPPKKIHTSKL